MPYIGGTIHHEASEIILKHQKGLGNAKPCRETSPKVMYESWIGDREKLEFFSRQTFFAIFLTITEFVTMTFLSQM